MNTCKTCKHWKPPSTDKCQNTNPIYRDDRFGECEKILCGLAYRDYLVGGPKLADQLAVIAYDVDTLATRPEFGCVLHEPK